MLKIEISILYVIQGTVVFIPCLPVTSGKLYEVTIGNGGVPISKSLRFTSMDTTALSYTIKGFLYSMPIYGFLCAKYFFEQ